MIFCYGNPRKLLQYPSSYFPISLHSHQCTLIPLNHRGRSWIEINKLSLNKISSVWHYLRTWWWVTSLPSGHGHCSQAPFSPPCRPNQETNPSRGGLSGSPAGCGLGLPCALCWLISQPPWENPATWLLPSPRGKGVNTVPVPCSR